MIFLFRKASCFKVLKVITPSWRQGENKIIIYVPLCCLIVLSNKDKTGTQANFLEVRIIGYKIPALQLISAEAIAFIKAKFDCLICGNLKECSSTCLKIMWFHTKDFFENISLTFPMLSGYFHPKQGYTAFWKPFKPCHVGIHWIASFFNSKNSHHQHKN